MPPQPAGRHPLMPPQPVGRHPLMPPQPGGRHPLMPPQITHPIGNGGATQWSAPMKGLVNANIGIPEKKVATIERL